jgi:hypothetical protein
MSFISIAGDVFVVTSSLKLEDLIRLKKYKPEALELRNDNGDLIYGVSTGGNGIDKNGASFTSATRDDKKLACITLPLPAEIKDEDEAKVYVAEYVALSLPKLKKVEENAAKALESVKENMEQIMESITVVGTGATGGNEDEALSPEERSDSLPRSYAAGNNGSTGQ